MPDLSKLSTEDLLALKGGDLSKVSTEGLLSLKGPQEVGVAEDVGRGVASGVARGLPYAIDVPAAAIATGVEKLAGSKESLGALFSQNMGNGFNAGASKVLGEEYQPQTYAGKVAKGAGMGLVTVPFGGEGALLAPATLGRAAAAGAGGVVGSDVGAAVGNAVGGDTGRVMGQVAGGLVGGGAGYKTPEMVDAGLPKLASGLDAATAAGGSLRAGVKARTPEMMDESAAALKQQASALYKSANTAGADIKPSSMRTIISDVNKAVAGEGELDADLHKGILARLSKMQDLTKGQPVSLETLDNQRKLLRETINNNTDGIKGPNGDAQRATVALHALDDAVEKLGPADITNGDATAVETLKQARGEWQRYRKFDTIANVLKQAGDDPNRIKAAMQRFVNKPKNMRGFSEQEVTALRNAAKNTGGELLLKQLGKFGFDLGTTMTPGNTFGPILGGTLLPHGPLLTVAGTAARAAQRSMARGKVYQALDKISPPDPKLKP